MTDNMNQFYLKIADIFCRLTIEKSLLDYFKKEYWLLKGNYKWLFEVKIARNKEKILKQIDFEAMAAMSLKVIPKNILFLHGSALIKHGKGYIFMGATGSGKSTIIKNIKKGIYAEDTVVIKKGKGKFYLYPSPFDKKKVVSISAKPVLVQKIFVLKKSKINYKSRINTKEKFLSIVNNDIYLYNRKFLSKKFYSLVLDLIKSTKVEKLHFKKDFNPYLELS